MFIDSLIADSWVCWLADSLIRLFGIPCFIDPLGHWLIASLLHWFVGPLLHWFVDSSTQYFAPSLIHWFTASLPHLTPRFIGCLLHRLIPCFVPSSIHWFIHSLIHRFIGSLIPSGSCTWNMSLSSQQPFAHSLMHLTTSNISLLLHRNNFPIGHLFPTVASFFRSFRPGADQALPSDHITAIIC
jgi:hypothetical protein